MFDLAALLARFTDYADRDAIVRGGQTRTYAWLSARIEHWAARLSEQSVEPGSVAALEADFSPDCVAMFFALAARGFIVVPLASHSPANGERFVGISQAHYRVRSNRELDEAFEIIRIDGGGDHDLYRLLRSRRSPGVVLFSSGSTGERKAVVHDLTRLLGKFAPRRRGLRTIAFLQLDHIGGLNTLLHVLANGGCVIVAKDRSPDAVLALIERHRAELLPTTPTFLNLLLVSGAHSRHDTSSLEVITYGTEAMPASTLERLADAFTGVTLKQTYGLSELGILRSKSPDSRSLWMQIGGDEFETRIVDGLLEIKADSAMLGYLNAPSPFTEDGWYRTGDRVEADGPYVRIIGRQSDVISVGGENVYPTEIESVLQELPEVAEATVRGVAHPITGQIVCAQIRWLGTGIPRERRSRIKSYCSTRLNPYEIPAKIEFIEAQAVPSSFKKQR